VPLTKPQKEVILCDKRFRVIIAGRRFGKTFMCIQEMAKFSRFPNQRVWYVSPSYRQSKTICWDMLKQQMIKHRWVQKINEADLSIVLRNNSVITLKGADNEQSLRGVGLNFVVMDEFQDIKPSAWYEVIRPTLSDTLGHALFTGTPKGFNFAYDLYSKQDPEWQSFKYTTIEGGQVSQEEIEQAKNDLDERTFQQEYLATFVNYAGIIYYNFDRNKHIINDYERVSKTIHIGMDFNISPMVCVLAEQVKNDLIIYDEIQLWSSNTSEMIDEIKNRYQGHRIVVYPDPATGDALTSHPDVNMVSFTGSTRAGALISENAAKDFKRVSLELGGKGANIIFKDADAEAVERGALRCFRNTGQSCNAPTRMLVEKSMYDEAVERVKNFANSMKVDVANKEGDHIGPVVSKTQFDKIQSLIQVGIDEGAKLVAGGLGKPDGLDKGYFVKPTAFADVNNQMQIARTEIFGPVLCIIPFETRSEEHTSELQSQFRISYAVFCLKKKKKKINKTN